MGKMKGFDKSALINELVQGKKYAKELRDQFSNQTSNHYNSTCSSSSSPSSPSLSSSNHSDDPNYTNQTGFSYSLLLLEKMWSVFDKTILLATSIDLDDDDLGQHKSLHSCTSLKSENSQPGFPPPKKRKTMMRKWTKSVKINNCEEVSGLQGALQDGFSWRKYGQKDILGSNFPRGYYRCTHRPTKGCVATKQVQRSDEDPTTYQILYKGDHTCYQVQAQSNPTNQAQTKSEPQTHPSPKEQEIYVGLGLEGELKVEPQQQAESQAQFFSSSFSPAFLDPEPIDNCMLSFTPAFGSPTTSGSNYQPVLPYQPTGPQVGLTVQTLETNNIEPVSGPCSVSNTHMITDFDFPIDEFQDIGYYFY